MKDLATELKNVQTSLHELQRMLLTILKKEREGVMGVALNPAEWFQMLLSAPEYVWLKTLNSFISDLDALSESSKVTTQDLAIVRAELERLFFKEDGDAASFNAHYRKLFANHHDVMYSHGHLKTAFLSLPDEVPPFNADEVRLGWHKIGASKRKLLN